MENVGGYDHKPVTIFLQNPDNVREKFESHFSYQYDVVVDILELLEWPPLYPCIEKGT